MENLQISHEDEDKNKRLLIVAGLVAVLVILSVFFCGYALFTKSAGKEAKYTNQEQYASATDDGVSSSLKAYMNQMTDENGNKVISDEAAEEIIAQITNGVLNSLPETLQNDEETVSYIREMIATSVTEQIKENNENVMSSEDYAVTTSASKDTLYYIDNVVVPMLTAELQISNGEVEDLKNSLTTISKTYSTDSNKYDSLINDISTRLSKLEKTVNNSSTSNSSNNSSTTNTSNTTTGKDYDKEIQALLSDLSSLESVLTNYKSVTSRQITTLEDEIASAKETFNESINALATRTDELEDYTEEQVAEIKAMLLKKIGESQNLTTTEITELQDIINNLVIRNEADLSGLQKQIEDAIAASDLKNSEALKSAVSSMETLIASQLEDQVKKNSELDATDASLQDQILKQGRLTDAELEALKNSLQGQIDNNKDLSDEERQKLLDIINNMDNSTASSITSIKKYFMEQLGDTNENITNIVNGMEIDLTDIRNAIANNKNAIDKMETMLGECSIEYHSDGFYAVYHKGEADEVSKKLDFAQ